jgi:drug/metabolite transporter (DMT)-like permease
VAGRRSLLPARGERLAAALLGTVGYAFESSLFFAGLERGSAAAVTVLFYAYPVVVAVIDVASGVVRPTPRLVGALVAGCAGTAVVVVAGADVSVTTTGIVFALAAAATFAVYLLLSARLLVRTDNVVRAAWVSSGAAVGLIVRGLVTGGFDSPSGSWPQLLAIGVANAAAFGFLFAALPRIGATRTAVVLNVEPVAAVVLAALFLDETLGGVQLLGGALVLVAAVAVAAPERPSAAQPLAVHPPP